MHEPSSMPAPASKFNASVSVQPSKVYTHVPLSKVAAESKLSARLDVQPGTG